jgi:Do/DeqQ family serine protease
MTNKRIQSNAFFFKIILSGIISGFIIIFYPSSLPATENNRENAVVKAVRKISPTVVNISSEYEVLQRANPFSSLGLDPFFNSFFYDFLNPGNNQREKRTSLGSGVIIDGHRGLILTNAHVVEKTGTIHVSLNDKHVFEAQIVGIDPDSDLALLKIDTQNQLPSVDMGDSKDIMIGETVIAIGNPFGFSHTVTTGVVSALNRDIKSDERIFRDFIQIDASINPGNSGGPLLNINGELIGINTAIYAKAQGIGFAIPINRAKRIVSDLIQYGKVVPAWVGLTVQNLNDRLIRYLNYDKSYGIIVTHVETDSPAQKAGMKEQDIILSIGDHKLIQQEDYQSLMKGTSAGDPLNLLVWRQGKSYSLIIRTNHYPMERSLDLGYHRFGIKVMTISPKSRNYNLTRANSGVIILNVRSGSYLNKIGVKPGDVIHKIDGISILDVEDYKSAVVKTRMKSTVIILLQRMDQLYHISVNLS